VTPDFLARGTPAAVLAALPEARAVGGAVRDFLAGKAIHDVDVAVPLPPEEVVRLLRAAGLKVFETGLQHGTVTAVLDREPVEVTSLRRDVATDGRHAEVEWIGDWREDAARRDFTINAMSMGRDGVLHDYFSGREDLAAGRVRFVGEASERLAEDYLRALRFFRFWARYGSGAPDAAAVEAIRAAVPGLARLSIERVWMELKRLLQAPDPRDALRLMAETGVLGAVLPEAVPLNLQSLTRLLAVAAPEDVLLRLCSLLGESVDHMAMGRRLKFSGFETERVSLILDQEAMLQPGASELRVLIWQSMTTARSADEARLPLWLADARDGKDRSAERASLSGTTFPLLGRDVIALGVAPGPRVGALLAEVRYWWMYEKHGRATHAECFEKLREVVSRTAEQ
jgi:poly(A) polymerase/tRNA nucleotidyltransferase (CCA-adding enzyme)